MTIPAAPRSRRGSRWIKLAFVPAGIVVVLGLAEITLRVAARVRGEPYSAAATEREIQRLIWLMTTSRVQGTDGGEDGADRRGILLHPYLGFDWSDRAEQIGRDVEHFEDPESARTYDILIVGGSVAAGFGDQGRTRLVQLLEADPLFRDRPVRIQFHGGAGFKQPQQLLLVTYLLGIGYRPDLVLNIDGFNECALGNSNVEHGVHPAHPSWSHWAHLASARRNDREALDFMLEMRAKQREASEVGERATAWHLHRSAIFGGLVCARLRQLRKQYIGVALRYGRYLTEHLDLAVTGPPLPAAQESARDLVLRNWFESSRSLDAVCRARSIHYLHVLQPTLHDQGSKPLTEDEIADGSCVADWSEGVHYGYPRIRELGAELRALGIQFVDASGTFRDVTERLYNDTCHFSKRGNELLASAIAAAILEYERSKQ